MYMYMTLLNQSDLHENVYNKEDLLIDSPLQVESPTSTGESFLVEPILLWLNITKQDILCHH